MVTLVHAWDLVGSNGQAGTPDAKTPRCRYLSKQPPLHTPPLLPVLLLLPLLLCLLGVNLGLLLLLHLLIITILTCAYTIVYR
jgi:hypothetical protein